MKKTIVGIIAHPDDEAFFMAGTLAKLCKNNNVYLICATNGQAGEDSLDEKNTLATRRVDELKKSAKILGVKNVYFLGFEDGYLSNSIYGDITSAILKILDTLSPKILITIAPNGITGHLDHIAISHIASFVFEKSRSTNELWQACFLEERSKSVRKYYSEFVYVPRGYERIKVNKIITISDVFPKVIEAISSHKSQQADINYAIKEINTFPKEEYFLVIKKSQQK